MKKLGDRLWNGENRLRKAHRGLRRLREGLNTRELEKQYLRYLDAEDQRGELSSFMMPEGQLVLRQRLQKREYQHLLYLLKIVRRNRQQVHQVLFFVVSTVAAILVVGFVLLKSPLLAEFLENRLGEVFATSVTIYSPSLHWNGKLEYAGISIARPEFFSRTAAEDDKLSNLRETTANSIIELGPGSLKISLWALLQNKILLNDFLSQSIQLKPWVSERQNEWSDVGEPLGEVNESEKTLPVNLEIDGIILDAKENFASYQNVQRLAREFSAGKNWKGQIVQNQQLISENYGLLSQVNVSRVTLQNGESLLQQARDLYARLQQQVSDVNAQLGEMNTQLGNGNYVLNSLSSTFESDFKALQNGILNGDILRAPVDYLAGSYLHRHLRNFGEISLWLAAVLRNLQQYRRDELIGNAYIGQRKKLSPAFVHFNNNVITPEYEFSAMLYPKFAVEYFEAGFATLNGSVGGNLKISTLSSDGDVWQSPVVAVYDSLQENEHNQLQLLFENRQLPVSQLPRHPHDCDVFGLDICADNKLSKAHLLRSQKEFMVPESYFHTANLGFIHSYRATLNLEVNVKYAAEADIKEGKKEGTSLEVELVAELRDAMPYTDSELNALQQALVAILSQYPLRITAHFFLDEEKPEWLRDFKVDSNIQDILVSTLGNREGTTGAWQNAISQLRQRLNGDLRAIMQPLQQKISALYDYRYRLQQQSYTLAQQQNNAEVAPSYIEGEMERQRIYYQSQNAPNP